ncbi:N-terminal acetyltransferase A, auxiliary subunit [Marasmius fiardii PR-910]|nr:N-terminal acetyltransferase A, auxiliary subunit [Marasmius fiardii PR-910]
MNKVPPKRALPSKEGTLFKELLTLYETRQLKKGIKTSDQILKKFPEHGETLCMKGLILTHMGRRDEGIEMVKKGVRLDLTSHIVWHVFGLIQKGEKNYEEALKSYTQALKFDKENLNILRDAAQLQTHLRLYDGLVETRFKLLKMRPMMRQNWIALAVAYHLNGNLSEAKKVLENYEKTLKNLPDYDIEYSETLLYHVRILEELGEWSEALSLLDANAKDRAIVDKTSIMEFRARLTSKLGSTDAEHAWRVLIEHNSECYDYYHGYLSNLGINLSTHPAQALKVLQDFAVQLPKANAPKRLSLTIAPASFAGEDSIPSFYELARAYLLAGLTKGIPSLYADIKSLYSDREKLQVIQDIVEKAKEENAPSADPSSSTSASEPTTYLWILYYLAQHYSYLSQHSKALSLLDIALSHTPTLPELYTFRARVLKRAGDPIGAAAAMEEARALDGQDRFLNTKSGKYLLRAGRQEEAEKVFGLFTKKDATSPGNDLEDMQSLLYLLEQADSQYRSGRLNLALKKYIVVQKIFREFEDDQYDFHGYSLRKFNIIIYFNLLKWEDRLRSNTAYIKTATSASRIFLAVHDDPKLKTPPSSSKVSDKAKKKAKKAAQKVQEDVKKAANNVNSNEDKGLEPTPLKDEDPDGLKLLACEDPLERAAKLLQPLVELEVEDIDVLVCVYDVAVRRKKLLQAIQALNRARKLDKDHPEVHFRVAHARKLASSLPPTPTQSSASAPSSPSVDPVQIFKDEIDKILPSELSLINFNSQYLQQHSGSSRAILAAARVSRTVLESPVDEVEGIAFMTLATAGDVKLDVKTALDVLAFLESIKSSRVEEFRKACDARFELSTVFKTPEEREKLAEEVFASTREGGNANIDPEAEVIS